MVEYHYSMTILKHRQPIKADGTLGPPEQIAGWTKPIYGGKTKGRTSKKTVALDSEVQEAQEI